MALTPTQLATMRDALVTAMASGTRSVSFQDRTIIYQSIDEMRKALATIDDEALVAAGSTPSRRSYVSFSKAD